MTSAMKKRKKGDNKTVIFAKYVTYISHLILSLNLTDFNFVFKWKEEVICITSSPTCHITSSRGICGEDLQVGPYNLQGEQ